MGSNGKENGNGWAAWGKHVLKEQERQDECIKEQGKSIAGIQVDLGMMKGKAFGFGSLGGIITGIITSLLATLIYNALAK